jgi:microcin C transport system permease protein
MKRLFQNELTRRRFRLFLKERRGVAALGVLLLCGVLSLGAELISNNRPIVLQFQGQTYFPIWNTYAPSTFGIEDEVVTDYRRVESELKREEGDYSIWPLNRWDPLESNRAIDLYPGPPTRENWMGTDDRGRDIFARLIYGYRYSMTYALTVWMITLVVGVSLGGMMGYFGGAVDLVGQRLVEILNTVPTFFLLIILVSTFEPTLALLVGLTSLFSWIGLSYYVRGEFLKNRKREYVESARALGARTGRIIFKHLLPNSLVPVITFSPFIISSQVLGLASLDYLGFGLRAPTPSWGELLNQAQKNFTTAWWLAVYPGGALFITLVMLALVGDAVRKAYDPKRG